MLAGYGIMMPQTLALTLCPFLFGGISCLWCVHAGVTQHSGSCLSDSLCGPNNVLLQTPIPRLDTGDPRSLTAFQYMGALSAAFLSFSYIQHWHEPVKVQLP